MRIVFAACFLLTLSLAVAAVPQGDGGRPRRVTKGSETDQDLKLQSDLVTLSVSVSDSDGRPVAGLTPDSFRVFEDEKLQRIDYFEPVGDPYSMMLVFDTSGSTIDQVEKMRAAARDFIAGIGPNDRLGIMSFSRGIDLHGDLTSDRTELNRHLNDIASSGRRNANGRRFDESTGTSFYDALYLACAESPLAQVESTGRKAVIVFSDCVDSTSAYKFKEIVDAVERSGDSVYFLLFDTREFSDRLLTLPADGENRINFSSSQIDRFYDEYGKDSPDRGRDPRDFSTLERLEINRALYDLAARQAAYLADRTGGRVYPVRSIGDLGDAYRQIAAELRTRYAVGYYPSNTKHDGTWRKLRVAVPGKPGAVIVTRSGYWAPKD
jgi:Ca-activated chloride channel family protein